MVKSYCRNPIPAIVLECEQKDFLYLDYFLMMESLPRAKQLPELDFDNNFLPQPNALTKIRLYPENKIWIQIILLSWINKQLWILIPSLNILHRHKHSDNLFISQGSIQIPPRGQKLICLRCQVYTGGEYMLSWCLTMMCVRNERDNPCIPSPTLFIVESGRREVS